VEDSELDLNELRRCLWELEALLPTLQKAVPQLRTLLKLAGAFGTLRIKGDQSSEQMILRPTKVVGKKDPDSTLSRVEQILTESFLPLSPVQVFRVFRERGWQSDLSDSKLRHLINSTIWHLKHKLNVVEGSAQEGYRLVRNESSKESE
jgi:hypothetical protein